MSAMDASLIFTLMSQITKTEEATIMAGMKSTTLSMVLSIVVSNSKDEALGSLVADY
jgi:hypothetical protein